MRTKFKAWTIPYLEEHKDVAITLDEVNALINDKENFCLEVGSGKGDFLLKMGQKFPTFTFVGVEKNVTCSGFVCKKLVENEVKNAFILDGDIEKYFPDIVKGKVSNVFLNFSDPWPKKRHAKRRLTESKFLKSYYDILRNGGKIYFKTDNQNLFDYSIKMFEQSNFKILSVDYDYDGSDEFDACTEYEANFRSQGMKINRLIASKE